MGNKWQRKIFLTFDKSAMKKEINDNQSKYTEKFLTFSRTLSKYSTF